MAKNIFFIMGVSGTGKTTIGKLLAAELEIPFFDGDDYHPKGNIKKMTSGIALNDTDRYGWLLALNQLAKENKNRGAIIACSALKEKYRILLKNNIEPKARFIFLEGTYTQIKSRIDSRERHFMSSTLLKSQFETLEAPDSAITVSIMQTPEKMIQQILKQLKND
jgi:carbohydrate kinase (thermoresistant glucokinase family)